MLPSLTLRVCILLVTFLRDVEMNLFVSTSVELTRSRHLREAFNVCQWLNDNFHTEKQHLEQIKTMNETWMKCRNYTHTRCIFPCVWSHSIEAA